MCVDGQEQSSPPTVIKGDYMTDKEYIDLERKYNDLLEQHKQLDDRVNRMIEEKYNLCRECEELKERLNAKESN